MLQTTTGKAPPIDEAIMTARDDMMIELVNQYGEPIGPPRSERFDNMHGQTYNGINFRNGNTPE